MHHATVSRRSFMQCTAMTGVALMVSRFQTHSRDLAGKKPNFVIIFTDDQGYQDLGCFGSPLIKTPNIDRMAGEGVKFTDFYVAAPVCSPSRAALLTGCYPQRIGWPFGRYYNVFTWQDSKGLNPDEITMAELLRCAGYTTACIGKWHLGHREPFLPTNQGFDYFYGLPYSNDMPHTRILRNTEVIENDPDNDLLTKKYTEEALSWLDQHHDDSPFLLYLAHSMPHIPLGASSDFSGKSDRGAYGDAIEEIDWSTGRVLGKIKDLGIDDNTFVIFTSDNGPWYEEGKEVSGCAYPMVCGKKSTREGGMRVPCVMRWPGKIPAGHTCSELATTMDLYPTFAHWAGIEVPGDRVIDGKNIAPLITGQPGAVSPHEAFLYFNGLGTIENDTIQQVPPHAIRMGEWKYYFNEDGCGNDPYYEHPYPRNSDTLYNLTDDIAERNNLASQYPDKVREMKARAEEMFAEIKANARPVGRFDEKNWSQSEHECPGMTSMRHEPAMSRARPVRSRHFRSETFNVSGKVVRERNGSRKAKGMYVNKREERSAVSPLTNDGHQDRGALPKP